MFPNLLWKSFHWFLSVETQKMDIRAHYKGACLIKIDSKAEVKVPSNPANKQKELSFLLSAGLSIWQGKDEVFGWDGRGRKVDVFTVVCLVWFWKKLLAEDEMVILSISWVTLGGWKQGQNCLGSELKWFPIALLHQFLGSTSHPSLHCHRVPLITYGSEISLNSCIYTDSHCTKVMSFVCWNMQKQLNLVLITE